MAIAAVLPEFEIDRNTERCITCQVCERVCAYEVHEYWPEEDRMQSDAAKCAGCQFCVSLCPTGALCIYPRTGRLRPNSNWTQTVVDDITKQANTGGVLLTGMGCDRPYKNYWDHLLLNASQVTNPSIDPLREPMELRTFIGRKPDRVFPQEGVSLASAIGPQLVLESPLLFSAMSYGSISLNAIKALGTAALRNGIYWNTGEGGLARELYPYQRRVIVQVASGRFGVDSDYLGRGAAIEIKVGQGAKPGIGGHLPGEKVGPDVAATRRIPQGTDALSPAPHHDIYSIEDLRQLIYALKEATQYEKPVGVKIAAVHNVAAIVSGIVRAGADFVTIDGIRGGTGAAPKVIRDNVGIPVELALAVADARLREEKIRNQASLIVAGGFRSSADVVKAIALGADAVYLGTAALVALGCHVCQKCYTGKCNWGIATQDPNLTKRLNPELGAERLSNLLRGWSLEIKEMLGGMGINALESLRGNREHLRAVDLTPAEMAVLGVKQAGEAW